MPPTGNQVAFSTITEFLQLPFGAMVMGQDASPQAAGTTIFSANLQMLLFH
jgi:hypothetical protein